MIAGTLELQLLADVARLRADMEKATGIVSSAAKTMDATLGKLKASIAGLAAGLTVGAFTHWIKGAIDSADAANKMAQKTGIAVQELAGLQLAYKQADVEGEAFQKSIVALNEAIAKGNLGFDALGIKTKTSSGHLKDVKTIINEVADQFKAMDDGVNKTAIASEIFGQKIGANLIPVLNSGSQGLREMDEMAKKLGLTLSAETAAQAEVFNDTLSLIGEGVRGIATQLAARLLPTLVDLAERFFNAMTEGDNLEKTVEALATALKLLYNVGQVVAGVFNYLSKVLGSVAAALVLTVQGQYGAAFEALKKGSQDAGKVVIDTAKNVASVWTESGGKTVESMAKMRGAQRNMLEEAKKAQEEQARLAKEREAAAKRAAAEAEKQAEAFNKLRNELFSKDSGYNADFVDKMTLINSEAKKRNLNDEQYYEIVKKLIEQQPFWIKAQKEALDIALEKQKTRNEEYAQVEEQMKAIKAQQDAETHASYEAVKNAQEELDNRGKLKSQIAETIALRLEEKQALVEVGSEAYNALQIQIDNQRKLADILRSGEILDAQEAAAKKASEAWADVSRSFVDNLMKGGKSVAQYLKDLFRTLVLRPILQPVGDLMGQGISALLGGSGAVGNAGGLIGGLAGVGSMFGSGGLMGAMAGGAGWLTGATTLGGSLTAAGSLIGTGTGAGIMSGIGMGIGALGPIALGAYGVYKLAEDWFGGGGGPKQGGYYGASTVNPAGNGVGMGDSYNQGIAQYAQQTIASFNQQLNAFASQFGKPAGYQFGLGISTDPAGDAPSFAEVTLRNGQGQGIYSKVNTQIGRSQEELQAAIAQMMTEATLAALESSGIDQAYKDYMAKISQGLDAQGQAAAAQQTLALAQFSLALEGLGGSFAVLATASLDAKAKFVNLAGGIENAMGMISSYMENFYSDVEKQSSLATQISNKLMSTNLFPWATPEYIEKMTREQFKQSVDFQLKNQNSPELGASPEALNALLQVQAAFNELHPAIDKTTGKIEDATGAWEELQARLESMEQETRTLQIELLQVQGKTNEARAMEVENMTSAEKAIYDRNAALRDEIEQERKTQAMQGQIKSSLIELARAQGNMRAVRSYEIQGYNEAQIAIYDYNAAIQEMIVRVNQAKENVLEAKSDVQAAYESEAGAVKDSIKNLESSIVRVRAFAVEMRNFSDSLLVGEMSPLTPLEQYNAARSQFESVMAAAKTGDEGAQSQLRTVAQSFLEASRLNFASSDQYVADFNKVRDELGDLTDGSENIVSQMEEQIDLAKDQLDSLNLMVEGILQVDRTILSLEVAIEQFYQQLLANAGAGGTPQQITTAYFRGYLGRDPTEQEMSTFSSYLAGGGTAASLAMGFTNGYNSSEYFTRLNYRQMFGTMPADTMYFQQLGAAGIGPTAAAREWMYDPAFKTYVNSLRNSGDMAAAYAALRVPRLPMGTMNDLMGWPAGTLENWARANNYPIFHKGGIMPHTGFALLERGERIIPRNGGSDLQDLVTEIRALREENRQLAEKAIAANHASRQSTANTLASGMAKANSREQFNQQQAKNARL